MNEIIKKALELKEEYGDISNLLKSLGLSIKYTFLENIKACTFQNVIFLNYDIKDYEKDFIIAHEIGHIILHDESVRQFSKLECFRGTREETQANLFATVFLGYKYDDNNLNEIQKIVNKIYCNYLNDF